MIEANRQAGETDLVDFLIAMIEAEASGIGAGDFSVADKALAKQGLALDALFFQLAREAAEDIGRGHEPMRLALSAQSQCRRTLFSLASSGGPRSPSRERRDFAKSDEQTIESGNRIG